MRQFSQKRLAIATRLPVHAQGMSEPRKVAVSLSVALTLFAVGLGAAPSALADPQMTAAQPEVDTSITRDYEPAIVYLHDPQTHELVPRSVLVGADEPVEGAVEQIIQSYEGQDVGIEGYEVSVDSAQNEAEINFNVDNPRGADAFQSLSSANQYSLFEAIRETLLTQPMYEIDEVIFTANGAEVEI